MAVKRIVVMVALLLIPISGAQAASGTLKGGYPACVTKALFDQIVTALVSKDENAFNYLMKSGCVSTKAGLPVTILDWSFSGTAKVRVYVGGKSIVLFTNMENVIRKR